MQLEIIERSEMILAGIVDSGAHVSQINIAGLWDRFIEQSDDISNQVDSDKGYELHIEEDRSPRKHFILIGVEVDKVEHEPLEIFTKVLPAGKYLKYTHKFSEGGYAQAFESLYDWLEDSEYGPAYAFDVQCYDERFNGPDDPESIIEILVPVKQKTDN
jgi:AraC family transcriptional regulator